MRFDTIPGEVYIVYKEPDINRPLDIRTPLEIPDKSEDSYLLSYKKRRRGIDISLLDMESENIFDRYKYTG